MLQYIFNIISLAEIFYIAFCILTLWNWLCVLNSVLKRLIWTSHILSSQEQHVASSYQCGQCGTKEQLVRGVTENEDVGEKLLLNHKRPGFLASGGEFNPRPETRLDRSELLCNKVLLKYKRGRESFWHRHQKWAERVPPCQSLARCYIATSSLLIKERKCLKTQRMAPGPSPTRYILR